MELFHAAHSGTALEINVSRVPYSFIGADRSGRSSLAGSGSGEELSETWHDALLGYMGNDPGRRAAAESNMQQQAAAAGIQFDYNVLAQWQPVDSQRLLLWSGRFGLQEEFMTALNLRHFQQAQSASLRSTLLEVAAGVGLDEAAATAFLDTDELADTVWESYDRTINHFGIRSIPLFSFSVPAIDAVGGPFRPKGKHDAYVVRGSMSAEFFLELFEVILRDSEARGKVADERGAQFLGEYDDRGSPGRRRTSTEDGGSCGA
jgi:predicted DsbA family dithiol-disulfide isomerase